MTQKGREVLTIPNQPIGSQERESLENFGKLHQKRKQLLSDHTPFKPIFCSEIARRVFSRATGGHRLDIADKDHYAKIARDIHSSGLSNLRKATMPWILRFAIGALFVFVIGAAIIVWACLSTGWETLSRFASGSVIAGSGLIASALLSVLSAVIHKGWRRFSFALMTVSILLFIVLLIFARFA